MQALGLTGVVAAETGGYHSLAVRSDGTLWAWGRNSSGQLGDGTTGGNRWTAGHVVGVSGVVSVAAGDMHSVARRTDGTAWAWGSNSNGQLGDGTAERRTSPTQVAGLTGVAAIAAGGPGTALRCEAMGRYGRGEQTWDGQLGDSSVAQRNSPVQALGIIIGCVTFEFVGLLEILNKKWYNDNKNYI